MLGPKGEYKNSNIPRYIECSLLKETLKAMRKPKATYYILKDSHILSRNRAAGFLRKLFLSWFDVVYQHIHLWTLNV